MEGIDCSGFTFYNDFDSANLAKVVYVPPNESVIAVSNNSAKTAPEIPDAEFNLWTKPDCSGTEFENGNRTWFYFGVKAHSPCLLVRLNIVDLNRQGKMYSQGMAPVFRIVPGRMQWERIRDKPVYNTVDDIFTLSFKFKTPENVQSITYFAFTYPFSYTDLQKMLTNIDLKFDNFVASYEDDIYYTKEVVCRSLGGREVNLLTISSYHGITPEMEVRLKNLFPDKNTRRPFKFMGKKVIFVSARVHPGETPSTFVFNGFLNLLLTRDDPMAIMLRRLYVFKMIPFLNPDGVALGHYRTDTRGVNLNRVYLNPLLSHHPPVYAARALIRYYHHGFEKEESSVVHGDFKSCDGQPGDSGISTKVSHMSLEETECSESLWCAKCSVCKRCRKLDGKESGECIKICEEEQEQGDVNSNESGLFLYVDMHGHASKKGIFMYGNHFQDLERNVDTMLLPKLMSINNHHFHFTACNFTERNMYLRDRRDGMSREGSGRVAVLKLTGLTKSYTLECNYNTGRIVNVLPPTVKESHNKVHTILVPPKFTPQLFEEVGRSLGASILDVTGQNPCTRIPHSEFHSIAGLRDWLRLNCAKDLDELKPKMKMRTIAGLHNQGKSAHALIMKSNKRIATRTRPSTVPIDRKENVVSASQPGCSHADKPSFRLDKLQVKSKIKKDFTNKFKADKKVARSRGAKSLQQRKQSLANLKDEQERKKLREICVLKSHEKAKREMSEESFTWKPSCSSQMFSKKSKELVEAGTSKAATYLVHNFGKNSPFQKCKFKKHGLRRLTKSATDAGKVDKGKKRKKSRNT